MMALPIKFGSRFILSVLKSNKITDQSVSTVKSFVRGYAKKKNVDRCAKALVDLPPKKDPVCPKVCDRNMKEKETIFYKIKLKILEGGSNFGAPFRKVQCQGPDKKSQKTRKFVKKGKESSQAVKALPAPKKKKMKIGITPAPDIRPGVQVSILGAETCVGQYLSLLLKQCPTVKNLRLYEATVPAEGSDRNICNVVNDLLYIDTNCGVQAFTASCCQLERCLQSSDIVVILENGSISPKKSLQDRFKEQAPIVKLYADAIATECPDAFIIMCAGPIDCMVPLMAQALKDLGSYNPKKLLGSMAAQEMRASSLASRVLGLDPQYCKVPCVGGTEGCSLVPLFSKAVEFFDFSAKNAVLMTNTVRKSQAAATGDGEADLSEAHAVGRLVSSVSHALLCNDLPRVSGFVETDAGQVISPARFLGINMMLSSTGIEKKFDIPRLNQIERELMDLAFLDLKTNVDYALAWYSAQCKNEMITKEMKFKKRFNDLNYYHRVDGCTANLT